MIRFDRVVKRYANSVAVDHLSLEIKSGETVILVGPSGCGKTTSLKMINRLIEPTEGTIIIDDRDTRTYDVNDLRRSIGYVIQQVGLFPHQTVAENVATVPRLLNWPKQRIQARVEELLDLIGLPAGDYARRLPAELSGGERQRVGVARALGADPNILLMDEPFGAIDPIARERLQNELLRLQSVVRKTIVFVTHDIDEAVKLGDRVALLSKGGKLEQFTTPEELLANPQSQFVTGFLGEGPLVRRLALIPIRDVELTTVNGAAPFRLVAVEGTLRDALDAVLRAPDGRVLVVDGDRTLGLDRRGRDPSGIDEVAVMPHLPAWVHRLRPFAVPIWVVIGILLSIGVYQTLTGKPFNSEVINAPNLMMETISHIYISGISFALVAAIGVPVGVVIAQAGRLVRVPVFLIANLGQAIPASACWCCCSHSSASGSPRLLSRWSCMACSLSCAIRSQVSRASIRRWSMRREEWA